LLVVGDADVVAGLGGLGERHEAGLGAEQAGVDQGPLGLPALVVQVDGVDGADAGAVPVQQGAAFPGTHGVDVWHVAFLPVRSPNWLLARKDLLPGALHDADPEPRWPGPPEEDTSTRGVLVARPLHVTDGVNEREPSIRPSPSLTAIADGDDALGYHYPDRDPGGATAPSARP